MQDPRRVAFLRFLNWLRQSASFLWLVGAAIYLSVLAGAAVYRNYQSKQELLGLQRQLAAAQLEKERLQAEIVYYGTDSYQNRELRRTMLLKEPNEKVYALPESSVVTPELTPAPDRTNPTGKPNWRLWWEYLLHRAK